MKTTPADLTSPGTPPINPAGLEQLQAEKRAEERRAREKEEKEKAKAAQEKADEQLKLAQSKAALHEEELRAQIRPLRVELENIIEHGRKDLEQRREKIKADEAILGDLQGAIITAIDLARTSPSRAIDTLNRAKERFDKTK